MPRPTRRSASRRPPETEQAPAEEIEVVDPPPPASEDEYAPVEQDAAPYEEAPAEEAPVEEAPAPSVSGRRRPGRSSRRAAAGSNRQSARTSSRRELTPEQKAARRAATMTVIKICLGVVFGLGTAFAAWWFLIRTDERTSIAQQQLAEVRSLIQSIETAIVTLKEPRAAEESRLRAVRILEDSPQLGYAREVPDPNNEKLVRDPALPRQAFELRTELDKAIRERVERAERDRLVGINEQRMKSGLANLGAMTDAELANFEKDFGQYLENPVIPTAGASEQYKKDYVSQITGVRVQKQRIEDEKRRRTEAITDLPVRDTQIKTMPLVQAERFRDALAMIDEQQRTFPQADFAKVREFVQTAAEGAWKAASAMADENYKTYRMPGTPKETARMALETARGRMQQIIDRFGVDEYVAKAQAQLARYVD